MVTLDYHTLVADLTDTGIATTSTGDPITAGQARRLACQAGLVPVLPSPRAPTCGCCGRHGGGA